MISLKKLSKYKKDDWYVEQTHARPIILTGITKGFTDGLKLKDYSIIVNYCKDEELYWITLIKDQNELGSLIYKKHKENKNYWKNEFKKYLKIREEIEENLNKSRKKDISKISDKEILYDIKRYINLQLKERRVSSLADPFIFYSERLLEKELEKFTEENPGCSINTKEAGEILTRPEEPSFLSESEAELLRITKEIEKDKNLRKKIISGKIKKEDIKDKGILKDIEKNLDKYCWIKCSFYGGKDYNFEDAVEIIRDFLKKKIDKETEKNESWKGNKKIKKEYISKYKFNKDILAIAELSPLFSKWQDIRKESTLIASYLHSKYLKELSKRTNVSEEDLAYIADYSEIENLYEGKLSPLLLRKRRIEDVLFIFQKDKFKEFYQEKIGNFIDKIINSGSSYAKEIKGMVASQGKAVGTVRIVTKEEDVKSFKKGQILVSTMTRPDHILALKKAAAIVTNEGGITCHAAIVARELGIPCIIGTRIATKVLKDGDLVEVDADRGVVRKIK